MQLANFNSKCECNSLSTTTKDLDHRGISTHERHWCYCMYFGATSGASFVHHWCNHFGVTLGASFVHHWCNVQLANLNGECEYISLSTATKDLDHRGISTHERHWCYYFGVSSGASFVYHWCNILGVTSGASFVYHWCNHFGVTSGASFVHHWCYIFGVTSLRMASCTRTGC